MEPGKRWVKYFLNKSWKWDSLEVSQPTSQVPIIQEPPIDQQGRDLLSYPLSNLLEHNGEEKAGQWVPQRPAQVVSSHFAISGKCSLISLKAVALSIELKVLVRSTYRTQRLSGWMLVSSMMALTMWTRASHPPLTPSTNWRGTAPEYVEVPRNLN